MYKTASRRSAWSMHALFTAEADARVVEAAELAMAAVVGPKTRKSSKVPAQLVDSRAGVSRRRKD